MKKVTVVLSLISVLCIAAVSFAVDEAAISKNVDTIVMAIESGTSVKDFAPDAYDPYAFIMETNGKMLVHPSLAGESLAEKAPPVFQALSVATPEGVWVEYEWQGKMKHTYARRTKDDLIVGSGY